VLLTETYANVVSSETDQLVTLVGLPLCFPFTRLYNKLRITMEKEVCVISASAVIGTKRKTRKSFLENIII